MKNFLKEGDTVTLPAPYAVSSGGGMLVGSIFAVAQYSAAAGEDVEGVRKGIFSDMQAVSSQSANVGAKVYWDSSAKRFTNVDTSNTLVGVFAAAKSNGETVCTVLLDGAIR